MKNYTEYKKGKIDKSQYKYTCKVCNEKFQFLQSFGKHIKNEHKISHKEYYDAYLKMDANEGKCKHCGKETKFNGLVVGYNKYCNSTCMNLERDYSKMKETWSKKTPEELEKKKERYLNSWNNKTDDEKLLIIKQIKETKKERYGDENWNNSNKSKETKYKKYGEDYYSKLSKDIWNNITPERMETILQKRKVTCIKKYNRTYPYDHEKCKETKRKRHGNENYVNIDAIKQHFTEKYGEGITNPSQVPEIHKKMTSKYKAPNGKMYDSKWEYKYEQYLIENNIKVYTSKDLIELGIKID